MFVTLFCSLNGKDFGSWAEHLVIISNNMRLVLSDNICGYVCLDWLVDLVIAFVIIVSFSRRIGIWVHLLVKSEIEELSRLLFIVVIFVLFESMFQLF